MSPAVGSVSVSLRGEDGVVREKKWAAGAPDPGIARTVPWRTFRWRHGQRHYSGTYFFLHELEEIIREWSACVCHHTP